MSTPLSSYFTQLQTLAEKHGVDLRQAFKDAGLPSSTFYRAKQGTSLYFDTACKVAEVIADGRA